VNLAMPVILHALIGMEAADLRRELEALHDASYAWAMCCCRFVREDAEDALHVTYVKVLDGRARFGERSAFRTWLFGVIRRTASEVRRRELARAILTGRIFVAGGAADRFAPAPDVEVAAARERDRVRRALRSLSARQREVLELVAHQDLTLDEAAAVLRISPGTARTHYERGKAALRAALEPHDRR
jgi:RNA polymerase sigma factor (sigma-70 family)